MSYNYGYGALEDQLIDIFKSVKPDFSKAQELVNLGANLNAESSKEYQDENILEEILLGFCETNCDIRENCKRDSCVGCTECISKSEVGEKMISVIKFFLDNGFDVSIRNYAYGAQCLYALKFSTHDKYILPCAKLLLDAGAKDVSPYDDEDDTVSNMISFDSFFEFSNGQPEYGNILETYYQILQAATEGLDYHAIDFYEAAYGKTITKVFAVPEKEGSVFFDLDLPESSHKNCYNSTLYFAYDGGYLVNTQYADIWTNAAKLPDNAVDVSDRFVDVCDAKIMDITFDIKQIEKGITSYTQPIIYINMDNGVTVKTTINFGEVPNENRTAYYEILKS